MEPLICPLCRVPCDSPNQARNHKHRYHSVPLALVLPDGTTRQVTKEDDGDYVCWCGVSHKTRDVSTTHVQVVHFGGQKVKVFRSKTSEFHLCRFDRLAACSTCYSLVTFNHGECKYPSSSYSFNVFSASQRSGGPFFPWIYW